MGGVFGKEEPTLQTGPPPPPRAEVFSVMRNGHEVLRGMMRDMTEALAQEDDAKALRDFKKLWAEFKRWQAIHARMEDGIPKKVDGFFKVLDKESDGVASSNLLPEAHFTVHASETSVDKALRTGKVAEVREAYTAFSTVNEDHLKAEEDVMMPQVRALREKGVDLRAMLRKDIMPTIKGGEMPFWLGAAMRVLEKHHEGKPRARVFAHAIQAISTEREWVQRHKIIRANLSPEGYATVSSQIDMSLSGGAVA